MIALGLAVGSLLGFAYFAEEVEGMHIHELAPLLFSQKTQGAALQRAALLQPDLVPFYGSSELVVKNPYHASAVFRDNADGFNVFPVAKSGNTCLSILQKVAAASGEVRAKQMVVSLSPLWFFRR